MSQGEQVVHCCTRTDVVVYKYMIARLQNRSFYLYGGHTRAERQLDVGST